MDRRNNNEAIAKQGYGAFNAIITKYLKWQYSRMIMEMEEVCSLIARLARVNERLRLLCSYDLPCFRYELAVSRLDYAQGLERRIAMAYRCNHTLNSEAWAFQRVLFFPASVT